MPATIPTGRQLWDMAKVYAAVKDVPEVAILLGLCSGAVCMGLYSIARTYSPSSQSFFWNREVRGDMNKQYDHGTMFRKPSLFWKVAQRKVDENGMNLGVFDNRTRPFEYNLPVKGTSYTGPTWSGWQSEESPVYNMNPSTNRMKDTRAH